MYYLLAGSDPKLRWGTQSICGCYDVHVVCSLKPDLHSTIFAFAYNCRMALGHVIRNHERSCMFLTRVFNLTKLGNGTQVMSQAFFEHVTCDSCKQ